MSYDSKDIGERIYIARVSAHMTKQEFAKKLGVSVQTVSNYESGTSSPDFQKAWAIADMFGVSLDEMFGHVCQSAIA